MKLEVDGSGRRETQIFDAKAALATLQRSAVESASEAPRTHGMLARLIPKVSGGRQLLAGDIAVGVACLPWWDSLVVVLSLGWMLAISSYSFGGLYRPRLHLSLLDQLPQLLGRSVLSMAAAAAVVALIGMPIEQRALVIGAGVLIAGQLTVRGLLFCLVRFGRSRGLVAHPTLLIGNGANAQKAADVLGRHRSYGLRVVGYLADEPSAGAAEAGIRYLGKIGRLAAVVRSERVTIAIFDETSSTLAGLLDEASDRYLPVSAFIMPQDWKDCIPRVTDDRIGAVPIFRLNTPASASAQRQWKRLFDISLAIAGLVLLSPVMALTALLIFCEDGHGPMFRQVRVGRDGALFTMYKFRSMRLAAAEQSDRAWLSESTSRIGRVGGFIRKTSIDELPQLVNILRGEMTFVGPRPERPHYVEQFSAMFPDYTSRHRVAVGLTGLAQVSGLRGDTSIDDRVRHDNYYIDHWSLWFDIKVLIWTIGQAFGARGT